MLSSVGKMALRAKWPSEVMYTLQLCIFFKTKYRFFILNALFFDELKSLKDFNDWYWPDAFNNGQGTHYPMIVAKV